MGYATDKRVIAIQERLNHSGFYRDVEFIRVEHSDDSEEDIVCYVFTGINRNGVKVEQITADVTEVDNTFAIWERDTPDCDWFFVFDMTLPPKCEEVQRLEKEINRLKRALKWYALMDFHGERARKALQGEEV
jgi:hypothetical protein